MIEQQQNERKQDTTQRDIQTKMDLKKINKFLVDKRKVSKRYECINCGRMFFKIWALEDNEYICEMCKSKIERKGRTLKLSKKTGDDFLNKRK